MAMNKAERLRMETLETQLREARALRFTDPVSPDIPKPAGGSFQEISGYTIIGSTEMARVDKAWSSCVSHGTGYASREEQKKMGSGGQQQGRDLYSTRLLALRGFRCQAENAMARKLAAIDKMIEAELAEVS